MHPIAYRHHRVLIIDDYPGAAEMLALQFQAIGCQAEIAFDAHEGLSAGALFAPTLILLDLGLPRVDGLEACRRMRQLPWGRKARIVAFTGWGPNQGYDKAREAGFDDYVLKPVGHATLLKLLADCDAVAR